ncbi:hypothetical protein Poly51_19010 [Rubripirellula tenax]|uniref:Bacterial extracellular solute-binding protein n=1 Tax=Rubripirellula tenax TaxID=2528015 RepID=A0A5C6FCH9_9BACT|nr:hypothetical protein [Rubripirellula tenax]TWU59115.1 hypothetical protein Poly51_19010 [Rubripirellula tenax]
MSVHRISINRRQAIVRSASALAGVGVIGCNRPTAAPTAAIDARNDVPLRITWVGNQEDADAIVRGWASVSEQAITVDVIPLDRNDLQPLSDLLPTLSKSNDVIAVPSMLVAELVANESIAPLTGDDIDSLCGELQPAVRSGLSRYGADTYGIPITTPLPALMLGPSEKSGGETTTTWKQYDQNVRDRWNGKAAEPIADGWAAAMFLWRASSAKGGWLFSRETFAPLIDGDDYVAALSLMNETVSRYEKPLRNASQVWTGLCDGSLLAGIGFPTESVQTDNEIKICDLPFGESSGESTSKQQLFDPLSTIVAISTNCRQTAASKTFLAWISGGEGSQSVRQKISPTAAVRDTDSSVRTSEYSSWLETKLQSPVTLPAMQVIAAPQYYDALNTQVIRCLDGKSSAPEALGEVAQQWKVITESIGTDIQLRAWRRAYGMRA